MKQAVIRYSTLMIELIYSCETLIDFHRTSRFYIHETDLFIVTAARASTPTMKWLSVETVAGDRTCQINYVEFSTGVPLILVM
jgi:hypothetical protein